MEQNLQSITPYGMLRHHTQIVIPSSIPLIIQDL